MMQCFLCLEAKEDIADCMQIKSSKWEELKVEHIIRKYLWPSIMIKPTSQWFCLMCWNNLQDFHNFYVCIENAQKTQDNIFPISHKNSTIQTEYESQNEGECNNPGTFLVPVLMDGAVRTSINIVKVEEEFLSDNELEERYNSSRHGTIDELTSVDDTDYAKSQTQSPKFPEGDSTTQIEKVEAEFLSDNELEERYNSSRPGTIDDTMDCTDPLVIGEEQTNDDKTDYDKSQPHSLESPEDDATDLSSTTYHYQSPLSPRYHDQLLNKHIPMKCRICMTIFKNFSDLKKHSKEAHNKSAIIVCCDTEFDNRCLLVDHICCHLNPKYFKCEFCDKVLANRIAYRSHTSRHGNGQYTTCYICNVKLYKQCYVDYHKFIHAESKDKQIPCKECGVCFANEIQLAHHVKIAHSIEMCKICGESLPTDEALQLHLVQHSGTMCCNYCDIMVWNKIEMYNHFMEKHTLQTGARSYMCQVCNHLSASQNGMIIHVQSNHTTDLQHKAFKGQYKTGQIHPTTPDGFEEKQIHLPEVKRFPCAACKQREYLLSEHVKRVHMPIECQVCGEVSPDIKQLRSHMGKHAGMFCCETCGIIVSSMRDLKEHIKLKHNKKVDGNICPVCTKVSITQSALRKHIVRNHCSYKVHNCPRCKRSFRRKDMLNVRKRC